MSLVLAATPSLGIGKDGTLPWVAQGTRLPGDMAYFKKSTTETSNPARRNAVLMGRKTWEGIPERFRPLSKRHNIVLTRDAGFAATLPDGVMTADSLAAALAAAEDVDAETAVVIGGVALFEECVRHPRTSMVHLTAVEQEFPCDATLSADFTDALRDGFDLASEAAPQTEAGVTYRIRVYTRR